MLTRFRPDRLFSFPYSLLGKYSKRDGISIPILMYHSISDKPESSHPYFHINTSPSRFAQHMEFLKQNGYHVISLSDAAGLIRSASKEGGRNGSEGTKEILEPDDKYVVLTFDDAYLDFMIEAYPVLRTLGFAATVFLPTDFVDRRIKFNGRECLTWDHVRFLLKEGISFGSHTVTHPQLYSLDDKEIEYEIFHSKSVIEEKTQVEIDSFSYPFAFPVNRRTFVRELKEKLFRAGYRMGVSTRVGCATGDDDIFCLKRIPVNSDDDTEFLRLKLEGGYDWFYWLQRSYKKFKVS